MKIDALIVAAGRGTRLGSETPKQYLMLDGKMLLTRTVEALLACDAISMVRCVISPEARALYDAAIAPIRDPRLGPPVDGGADRAGSVRRGLEAMVGDAPDRVLIHDAARPFVTPTALEALCRAKTAAILAEPVVDALWRDADGHADAPVPRAGLWRAQTPQAFPFQGILAAHRAPIDPDKPALDDAETYRRAGGEVALITGEPDNFKITTSADFERARRMAAVEAHRESGDDQMETRIGHGYDTHRFVDGDAVWLCGVRIAHDKALSGHSDADVGLHALADALYGALAEGDIGRHFPPSDPQWKGAESHIFLSHAAGRVSARRGRVINVDLTLLCEAPKIAPHSAAMQAQLAELLEVGIDRVSVKATTMERMGFIGREEGMACIATVAVALPVEE